jgi:hypothetical protein
MRLRDWICEGLLARDGDMKHGRKWHHIKTSIDAPASVAYAKLEFMFQAKGKDLLSFVHLRKGKIVDV